MAAVVLDRLTTSAPRDASRPLRTTLAPWAAKATAIARPMLLVAPVTSAVFPCILSFTVCTPIT